MEALGTLALLWQVPDGPRGILRHPIQVKPLQADWCEDGLGWRRWKEPWRARTYMVVIY